MNIVCSNLFKGADDELNQIRNIYQIMIFISIVQLLPDFGVYRIVLYLTLNTLSCRVGTWGHILHPPPPSPAKVVIKGQTKKQKIKFRTVFNGFDCYLKVKPLKFVIHSNASLRCIFHSIYLKFYERPTFLCVTKFCFSCLPPLHFYACNLPFFCILKRIITW